MPQPCHTETARLVRHGRWVLGLSQEDFAARLGLEVTELHALETGRALPDGATLSALGSGRRASAGRA